MIHTAAQAEARTALPWRRPTWVTPRSPTEIQVMKAVSPHSSRGQLFETGSLLRRPTWVTSRSPTETQVMKAVSDPHSNSGRGQDSVAVETTHMDKTKVPT